MQESPRFFKAWLLFNLIAGIGGFLAAVVIGFVLGFILAIVGSTHQTIKLICQAAGLVTGLAISFYVFKAVVSDVILAKTTTSPQPDEVVERDPREGPAFRDDATAKSWGEADPWGDDPGR
jgi:hypothetical protein